MIRFSTLVGALTTLAFSAAASDLPSSCGFAATLEAEPVLATCAFDDVPSVRFVWEDFQNFGDYDPGDYEAELLEQLHYRACDGTLHTLPVGKVVNGASVPRAAWTTLGYTPWSGPITKPAMLHDAYTFERCFTSDIVHALFYETLLAEGVDSLRADLMYAVVREFGPQWDEPGGEVTQPPFVWGFFNLITDLFGTGQRILPISSGPQTALVIAPRSTTLPRSLPPVSGVPVPPRPSLLPPGVILPQPMSPSAEIDAQLELLRGLNTEQLRGLSEGRRLMVPRGTVPLQLQTR